MAARRLGAALLVPAGALAGHAAAYRISGGHAGVAIDHGYLAGAAVVAVPLALAGLVWHAAQGAQGARCSSLRLLVVTQSAVFVAQEALEHVLAGHGVASLVHSPALRLGITAQVVVALLVMLLVRGARATGRAVAALRIQPQTWSDQGSRPRFRAPSAPRTTPRDNAISERGPPPLLLCRLT